MRQRKLSIGRKQRRIIRKEKRKKWKERREDRIEREG